MIPMRIQLSISTRLCIRMDILGVAHLSLNAALFDWAQEVLRMAMS